MAKSWSPEAIEAALAAQGIALAPGRAARVARTIEGFMEPSMADRLRATIDFERDVPGFMLALERCRAK